MTSTRDIALLAAGAAMSAPRVQRIYESVRLLKEMEEKAEAKLIATLPLKNNLFEGTVVIDRMMSVMTIRARLVFVMNGKRIEITEKAYEGEGERIDLMRKLHTAASERIAAEILSDSVRELRW